MTSRYDLEQIAYNYLTSGRNYRGHLKTQLLNAGINSVGCLLVAGMRYIDEYAKKYSGAFVGDFSEVGFMTMVEAVDVSLNSTAGDIREIVVAIGQAALDELCMAYFGNNARMAILCSLVLLTISEQTYKTIQTVHNAFFSMQQHRPFDTEDFNRLGSLLILIMAQSGHEQARHTVERNARQRGITVEQYVERFRKEAWLYLLSYGGS